MALKFIIKNNEDKQEITAPILVPEEADYHEDIYSHDEVLKACRNFNSVCKTANLQHAVQLTDQAAEWVESYISPQDMTFQGPDGEDYLVKKGTWLGTMKIKAKALWEEVKKGTFTGFSIQGYARTQVLKSKVAGHTGLTAKTRLSDFDFSLDDCSIALVDEAANACQILLMKSKHSSTEQDDEDKDEKSNKLTNKQKEKEITVDKDMSKEDKAELEALRKAKKVQDAELVEIRKAKELKEAEDAVKLEKALKQCEDDKAELEELRKSKAKAEEVTYVAKAKDLGAGDEDAEKLGPALMAVKALAPGAYEVMLEHIVKMKNVVDGGEYLEPKGDNTKSKVAKSMTEQIEIIKKQLSEEDVSLTGRKLTAKARDKYKKDFPKEYEASLFVSK